MTHGEEGKLMAFDEEYEESELWTSFVNGRCPSLNGKPKLLFIQSCRGVSLDFGIKQQSCMKDLKIIKEDTDAKRFTSAPSPVIASNADILVMHSTQKGFVSFRNRESGTCFIQAVCSELQSLQSEAAERDLMRILTKVNREISRLKTFYDGRFCKQMPSIQSSLTKIFLISLKDKIGI